MRAHAVYEEGSAKGVLEVENAKLRAELRQCQSELVEAANIIRPSMPRAASLFAEAAKRVADKLAQ